MLKFTIPIKTVNESNQRSHWAVKAKRTASVRGAASLFGLAQTLPPDPFPLTVTLTRVSPGTLDDDGLASALKAARDGIADWLGVDDKLRDVVRYRYEQRKGSPYAIEVALTAGIAR